MSNIANSRFVRMQKSLRDDLCGCCATRRRINSEVGVSNKDHKLEVPMVCVNLLCRQFSFRLHLKSIEAKHSRAKMLLLICKILRISYLFISLFVEEEFMAVLSSNMMTCRSWLVPREELKHDGLLYLLLKMNKRSLGRKNRVAAKY